MVSFECLWITPLIIIANVTHIGEKRYGNEWFQITSNIYNKPSVDIKECEENVHNWWTTHRVCRSDATKRNTYINGNCFWGEILFTTVFNIEEADNQFSHSNTKKINGLSGHSSAE